MTKRKKSKRLRDRANRPLSPYVRKAKKPAKYPTRKPPLDARTAPWGDGKRHGTARETRKPFSYSS